jgi:hypothetical protein
MQSPLSSERSLARLCSVHSVSHTLDGFLLHIPCGFVSSHCRVRDFALQGFSPPPSWTDSSPAHPLLPFSTTLPQALAHLSSLVGPGYRVFTRQRPVAGGRGVNPPTARSPLEFSTPSGVSPKCLGPAFAAPPLMAFTAVPCVWSRTLASSVSIDTRPLQPVPRLFDPSEFSWPSFSSNRSRQFRRGLDRQRPTRIAELLYRTTRCCRALRVPSSRPGQHLDRIGARLDRHVALLVTSVNKLRFLCVSQPADAVAPRA